MATSAFPCYDGATAGLGKDPTVAYTTSSGVETQFDCSDFSVLGLTFRLVSGTAPTSLEYLLEVSADDISVATGSSVWSHVPVVVASGGGYAAAESPASITWALTASGLASHFVEWEIGAAKKFRIRVKRTGGAADTRVSVRAVLA